MSHPNTKCTVSLLGAPTFHIYAVLYINVCTRLHVEAPVLIYEASIISGHHAKALVQLLSYVSIYEGLT